MFSKTWASRRCPLQSRWPFRAFNSDGIIVLNATRLLAWLQYNKCLSDRLQLRLSYTLTKRESTHATDLSQVSTFLVVASTLDIWNLPTTSHVLRRVHRIYAFDWYANSIVFRTESWDIFVEGSYDLWILWRMADWPFFIYLFNFLFLFYSISFSCNFSLSWRAV